MFRDRSPRRRPETTAPRMQRTRKGFRWSWLLYVVPLLLVAMGTYAVLRSPWLTVQEIRVEGAVSIDRSAVAELSGLQGRSMLRLPLDTAKRRLIAAPEISSVAIERNWPSGVTIIIRERLPVAFWSVAGRDYVVDREGVVLAGGTPQPLMPRIVEVGSQRELRPGDRVHPDAIVFGQHLMEESPQILGETVDQLEYQAGVGVTVVLGDGLRVTFGDERSYEYKLAALSALMGELNADGIVPHAVDLRFGERVTYE